MAVMMGRTWPKGWVPSWAVLRADSAALRAVLRGEFAGSPYGRRRSCVRETPAEPSANGARRG